MFQLWDKQNNDVAKKWWATRVQCLWIISENEWPQSVRLISIQEHIEHDNATSDQPQCARMLYELEGGGKQWACVTSVLSILGT